MSWQDDPVVGAPAAPAADKKTGAPAAKPRWMSDPVIGGGGKPQAPGYMERVHAAGKEMDRQIGTGVSGVLKGSVAAGETALEILTTTPADVAGAVTSVITQHPEWGDKVREAIQTHPATSYGQATSKYVAAIAEPLGKLLNIPKEKLEKSGHPILAQIYAAVVDTVGLEEVGGAVKGVKKIGKEIAKPMPPTAGEKLGRLAGEQSEFRDTLKEVQKDAAQAKADLAAFRPVKDPVTGKYTKQGPAFAAAQAKADAAKTAADALGNKQLFRQMLSQESADIDSVKDALQKMGPYRQVFVDEAVRRMGDTKGEFNAVQFVRKYKGMPLETKQAMFAGVKGEQYMRDMNALISDIERISDSAKAREVRMPPGLHHMDFTRTDVIIASLVSMAGRKVGIPHTLGFGVGLYIGKPIEKIFLNPAVLHALRNTADASVTTMAETGRIAFGLTALQDERGQEPAAPAEPEPYEKRHGVIAR